MLKELKDCNTFASPQEVGYLLRHLYTKKRPLLVSDLKKFCSDHSIDFAFSFDGTLSMLTYLSIVQIEKSKVLLVKNSGLAKTIDFPEKLGIFLSGALFKKLEKDNLITKFLNHDCLGYDLKDRKISIKSNLVPLKFTNLLNLLRRMDFLVPSDASANIVLINARYQGFFEDKIIPLLRGGMRDDDVSGGERELSYEQFKRILQIKEKLGAEAERLVLLYELKRLANHKKKEQIKIISSIDVLSGYDIVSFNDEASEDFDRFIEVKSYSSVLRFYWSKNEVDAARVKGSNYFLYLINRNKISMVDYCPIVIQNPYEAVYLSDDWIKDSQEWLVEKEHILIKN